MYRHRHVSHSIRDFLDLAFQRLALDWNEFVEIDPRFYRPAEVDHLQGDAHKADFSLGWKPTHDLSSLVNMMVDADLKLARGRV